MEEMPMDEMKSRCRFCLTKSPAMRAISSSELAQSDIPNLYEIVTAVKLVISTEYSKFMCNVCEDQMKAAARIRADFLKVDQHWKRWIESQSTGTYSSFHIKEENADDQQEQFNLVVIKSEEFDMPASENELDFSNTPVADNISSTDDEDKPIVKYKKKRNTIRETKPKGMEFVKVESYTLFQCDFCGKNIQTKHSLQKHLRTHLQKEQTVCHICGKKNLKSMAAHLRAHRRAGNYKCSYCNRAFNRKIGMEQHERTHTGERPFFCEICANSFISASGLSQHRKMHLMDATVRREKERKTLTSSPPPPPKPQIIIESSDTVKDKLVCPVCSSTFTYRRSLQQHLKLQHVDGPDIYKRLLQVTCMVCYKVFGTAEQLIEHRSAHVEHECTICKRRFDNKLTLQYHQQTHSTKERPHRCEVCGCTFAVKKTLKLHFLRIHTDNRPHACSMCSKTFLLRSYLNNHIKMVHSQERPFQCQECPKSYKKAALLRYHQEKHTGQFRYSCSICSKPCHNGPLLTTHMKIHHPEADD